MCCSTRPGPGTMTGDPEGGTGCHVVASERWVDGCRRCMTVTERVRRGSGRDRLYSWRQTRSVWISSGSTASYLFLLDSAPGGTGHAGAGFTPGRSLHKHPARATEAGIGVAVGPASGANQAAGCMAGLGRDGFKQRVDMDET